MKKIFKIFAAVVGVVALLIVISIIVIYSQKDKIESMAQESMTKARQSEAKIILISLHTMQKMFYADFGTYTSAVLGSDQSDGIEPLRYKFGFANELAPDQQELAQIKTMAPHFDFTKNDLDKLGILPQHEMSKTINFKELAQKHGCEATKTTFKLCAIGYPADNSRLDVWTMDQDRNLVHVQDSLN